MQDFRKIVPVLLLAATMSLAYGADGSIKPRIIDGTNVPVSMFPTVGLLTNADQTSISTATLIAPKFILTAGHCVTGDNGQLNITPAQVRIKFGGTTYSATKITVHPTYKGTPSLNTEDNLDLAIVELDQNVPGITPSPFSRTAPTVGTLLTLVGYGEQGFGLAGKNNTFPADGTVNTGTTPIDEVSPTFVRWNFEQKVPPESNSAPGDSGGPQFANVNGVLTICSVVSGGLVLEAKFGDLSYNTRVDIAAAWIDSIAGTSAPITSGNNAPVIQSLSASTLAPAAGTAVDFTAAASDPDKDTLSYAWAFGDGTTANTTTGAASSTYTTAGSFSVTLTVTDGKGGSVQQGLTVVVAPTLTTVAVAKKKFGLNFASSGRNTLDFTLQDSKFTFASKADFQTALDGAKVVVLIGATVLDQGTVSGTKAGGELGTFTFTSKQGFVRYAGKGLADLTAMLAPFGAVNQTVTSQVTVPVRIEVNGTRYGGDATFQYKAKQEKTGTGK